MVCQDICQTHTQATPIDRLATVLAEFLGIPIEHARLMIYWLAFIFLIAFLAVIFG